MSKHPDPKALADRLEEMANDWDDVIDGVELRQAASLLRDMQWKDISSAPQDGSTLWLWDGKRQFEGWWQVNPNDEEFWMDESDSEFEPTHWMPLPPPPSHEGKG